MKRLILLLSLACFGHDLGLRYEITGGAVVVRAAYADREPCAYAAVLIYGPGDTKTEHQNGRTDAKGNFAFVPDRVGEWRAVIDDELGHKKEIRVAWGIAAAPAAAAPDSLPRKIVTGLALLFGLTGVAYGWTARRAR